MAASEDESEAEYHRRLRRNAQRLRRQNETLAEHEQHRNANSAARRVARTNLVHSRQVQSQWWDRVSALNKSQIAEPLRLRWNRNCKICGIKALTGERIHDKCFVCGPKGRHNVPLLPPYPTEWDTFINNRKTAGLSRKLNNIVTLTAIAVEDGSFMKFGPGISAVTLHRKQIPLALCYATTFNGCQGLTVQKLGIDLRRPRMVNYIQQ